MALKIIPGCCLPLSISLLLLIDLHLVYKTFFLPQLGWVNGVLAGPTMGLKQVADVMSWLVRPQWLCLGNDKLTSSGSDARH